MRAGRLAPLVVGGLLLIAPGAASASAACPGDDQVPTAATAPEATAALVCDINVFRRRNNLSPVSVDPRLQGPAQDLASDMAANHFVSHTSSDGRTTMDRVVNSPYPLGAEDWTVLENVDWGSGWYSTPIATAFGWLNSDEHREHMLDPDMQNVAIGIAEGAMTTDGVSGVFYVADFGARTSPPAIAASPMQTQTQTQTQPRACSSRTHATRRTKHRTKHRTRRVQLRRRCA